MDPNRQGLFNEYGVCLNKAVIEASDRIYTLTRNLLNELQPTATEAKALLSELRVTDIAICEYIVAHNIGIRSNR